MPAPAFGVPAHDRTLAAAAEAAAPSNSPPTNDDAAPLAQRLGLDLETVVKSQLAAATLDWDSAPLSVKIIMTAVVVVAEERGVTGNGAGVTGNGAWRTVFDEMSADSLVRRWTDVASPNALANRVRGLLDDMRTPRLSTTSASHSFCPLKSGCSLKAARQRPS